MYKLITYSDELYHYGVLGMRWGVRRYQNYDGTRIGTGGAPVVNKAKAAGNTIAGGQGGKAKGLARLAATANVQSENDSSEDSSEDKKRSTGEALFGPSVKNGKGKEDSSVAQKATKHLLEVDRSSKEIVKTFKDIDPKVKEAKESQEKKLTNKAKKMSDKELRDSINRIKMEREYVSLTTKETKTGYDKVVDVLEKAEPFLRVAGEVAGLLYLLYKFNNLKNLKQFDDKDASDSIYSYCVVNEIDGEILEHALVFDAGYIIDYYGLSDDDVYHILESEDELYHHGVKGMKWGVRRYQNYDGTRIGTGDSGKMSVREKAKRNHANAVQKDIDSFKSQKNIPHVSEKERQEIIKGLEQVRDKSLKKADDIAKNRSELKEKLDSKSQQHKDLANAVKDWATRSPEGHIEDHKNTIQEAKNFIDKLKNVNTSKLATAANQPKIRSDGKDESKFTREEKKISNDARKDAEEFARAKAFYGEGAGNRRKAIKTTVDAKKKKSKFYDEEFEYHLSQQDMEYHMREAKRERNSKDMTNNTRKALNKTNRALGQLSRYL